MRLALILIVASLAYGEGIHCTAVGPSPGSLRVARNADGTVGLQCMPDAPEWRFTRSSPTQLRFGDSCLPATPCNVAMGGYVAQFAGGPYVIDVSGAGSAGSICVYITPANQITVGIGNGLTAANIGGSSSLVFVPGVNGCPMDALKLARWDVANGAFSNGYVYASTVSHKPSPVAGVGIQIMQNARDVISIDTLSVLRKFACPGGPGNAQSGATLGDICWDFSAPTPGRYVCANPAGCAIAGDWRAF